MTTDQTYDAEEITYCAVHPDRETGLRCNRCNRYMYAQCAVQTPVGYRCRECVRQVDDKFFNAASSDPLIAAGVAAAGGVVLGLLSGLLGGFTLFLSIIIALPAGVYLGSLIGRALNKRRGRDNWKYALAGFAVGMFIGGFAAGWISYPDHYRLINDQLALAQQSANTAQEQAQVQSLYEAAYGVIPSQTEYALEQVIPSASANIGLYLFLIIAGYGIYLRMKP